MSKAISVVLADSNQTSGDIVANYLLDNKFECFLCSNASNLTLALSVQNKDIIIFNTDFAAGNYIELIRTIRGSSEIPILVVAARGGDAADRVIALELGADGYIEKPLMLRELVARIRATVRRRDLNRLPSPDVSHFYEFDGWRFDLIGRKLSDPLGNDVPVTERELALLELFVAEPNVTFGRKKLIRLTDGEGGGQKFRDRAVDVQVSRLRKKLKKSSLGHELIRTVRGKGYIFSADVKAF